MKTKLSILFLLLINTFSVYAYVLDDPDTTHVTVRPLSPSIPGDDPELIPKPLYQGNIIIGNLYETTLSFLTSDFILSSIEVIVTDLNEVEYINTIVYEYNNVFHIDISSLPVGAYIISIKDGDDEYIGEFEVF